jgi:putative hydrolase of HD superfamily
MTDATLLKEAISLKDLARAGWRRVGVPAPESVAAHSWGVAFAALLRCPPHLNREKVLIMALLHDLAEVRVGDITPYDGISKAEKHQLEHAAMAELLVDHPELLALWHESEARQSPEACFLKEMDLLDMGLTAQHYAPHHDTAEFMTVTAKALAALNR